MTDRVTQLLERSRRYGLDVVQLREEIIRPALLHIGLYSKAAENLVLGTALTESRARYLRQLGGGPALSIWQIEPLTHHDLHNNYLNGRRELRGLVYDLMTDSAANDFDGELVGNLMYGAAMCRVFYRRIPARLPDEQDAQGMSRYWKKYYNTHLGAGTIEKALPHFEVACE